MNAPVALPERTRLFHVGPPKTGTTALQQAAAARRRELLANGVRYPGTGTDHGSAIAALLGQSWGWERTGGVPSMSRWFDLLAEIRSDQRSRVLFGHEFAAKADEATIERVATAVGDPLHVVITLRPFASMLPSTWQESLKIGAVEAYEPWLRRVLERPGAGGVDHPARNQGLLVSRWASVLGADRVTVIALDTARPEQLFSAFEGLLDLPAGLLAPDGAGRSGNRGLTLPESEFLLRVNRALRDDGVGWEDYADYIGEAAIGRVVRDRVPPKDEARIGLPPWAATRVEELAAGFVDTIRRSGVRVVGDLDPLAATVDVAEGGALPTLVPIDVAVTSVRGAIATATRREPETTSGPIDGREYLVVRHVGIGGLLMVVAGRVRRRGRKAVRVVPALALGALQRPVQRAKRRRHDAGETRSVAAAR